MWAVALGMTVNQPRSVLLRREVPPRVAQAERVVSASGEPTHADECWRT